MGPTQTCYCGKTTSTKRCAETSYGTGWSCNEVCGDLLPCGDHTCARPCHPGLCGACEVPVLSRCYCGKEQKEVACDRRDVICASFDLGQLVSSSPSSSPSSESSGEPARDDDEEPAATWFEASFTCKRPCGRKFDCGHHSCEKTCHPQDEEAAHCPLSPDVVSHCPCGKTRLRNIADGPRETCRDPIPHCDKACGKQLGCGHLCADKCHTGPCRPCFQAVDISCRCGRTAAKSACHQGRIEPPQCFRVCRAQRNCGRHECGEHCCSGERKAAERRRQKRNASAEFEVEHICLQPCGRTLKCGKHTCQQLCHKGPCPSCLEAVFDEISCACGRTVLQPPQPCGTRPPECRLDCTRPRQCGHPTISHQCHPDDVACPKCPFLVEKTCVCGKKRLKNQPCWFEDSRCGLPCGEKLKCGAHECRKECHRPGDCEDVGATGPHCPQPCGKVLKSCDHTCLEPCHAPYPCKEERPCQSKTFVTCPCQRRKQETKCLATRASPQPAAREPLRCDEECLTLQRNRRLAEALNIDPDSHSDNHIPYSDTTLKLFRDGASWAQDREREFRVFAADPDEKRIRFRPMPAHQRAFLHALAEDFGLDSESQDPEPHRHVCVFKTPRFVSAPRKTLAQCLRVARPAAAAASAPPPAGKPPAGREPFNAFLLTGPRFGLTIDELGDALAADLAAAAARSAPPLTFTTSFLPSDEIIVKASAAATTTAASVASASPASAAPAAVETALVTLRPAVARTVARLQLAGAVGLCRADEGLAVTRREGDTPGGWSTVAGRRRVSGPAEAEERRAPRTLLALRKRPRVVEEMPENEPVEEDWLAAAERLDKEVGPADEEREEKEGGAGGEGTNETLPAGLVAEV